MPTKPTTDERLDRIERAIHQLHMIGSKSAGALNVGRNPELAAICTEQDQRIIANEKD